MLQSAICILAPIAKLEGRETALFVERNRKLKAVHTLRIEQKNMLADYRSILDLIDIPDKI